MRARDCLNETLLRQQAMEEQEEGKKKNTHIFRVREETSSSGEFMIRHKQL